MSMFWQKHMFDEKHMFDLKHMIDENPFQKKLRVANFFKKNPKVPAGFEPAFLGFEPNLAYPILTYTYRNAP